MKLGRFAAFNYLLLSILLVLVAPLRSQDKEKSVLSDLYGDPLPPGAIARLGTTRLRHIRSHIKDAAFSGDGKILASVGWDSRLHLWDTANGKELQSIPLELGLDPTVAFSGDSKVVAVTSHKTIIVCDVGKAKARIFPQPDYVTGAAFAPDSSHLAAFGWAKTVSLIDLATGKEIRKLTGHDKAILSAAFSADGKSIVTTSQDLTCRTWNVDDGKQKSVIETNKPQALMLALSPDGKWIAWWDMEGKIHVHDFATGKERTSFDAVNGRPLFSLDWKQSAMSFAPNGTLQALYWSKHLTQWHPDKGLKSQTIFEGAAALGEVGGMLERQLPGEKIKKDSIAFDLLSSRTAFGRISPSGKTAALWDWDHGTTLLLVDVETGKEKDVGVGHLKAVWNVVAQPGGKLVASESTDGTIRLWDPAGSRELRRWRPASIYHPVAFTSDGKSLAFSDYDKKSFIRIVELEKKSDSKRLETERNHLLACSANGKVLLGADFSHVEIWDVAQGKVLRELEDVPETKLPVLKPSSRGPWLSYTIRSLTVSPDGAMAAAALVRTGLECSVYLWDTATGKKIPGWPGDKDLRQPIAFSPDGKALAAVQHRKEPENDLVLWDFSKAEIFKRFPIADISCHCVAFSRDGKLLALGGEYKGIVQVYDVVTGKEFARFQPHEGLTTLTFSDDGATLITGGDDSTILVWNLQCDALKKK
jgi:WD40 repeat protein